jgi:hypothetical protein
VNGIGVVARTLVFNQDKNLVSKKYFLLSVILVRSEIFPDDSNLDDMG